MLFQNGKPVKAEGDSQNIPLTELAAAMRQALGDNLAADIGQIISDKLAETGIVRETSNGVIGPEEMSDQTMRTIATAMSRLDGEKIESSTDVLGEETDVVGDKQSNRRIIDRLKNL